METASIIYSFDVFDTVITRVLNNPKDVFLLMQKEISQDDDSVFKKLGKKFLAVRIWGEFKARRHSPNADVSLYEIYHEIQKICQLDHQQIQRLLEKELKIEKKCLVPIQETIKRIKKIHRNGGRIIFISDMYLPKDFISDVLTKYGVFHEGDSLYVSGEIGLTKGSGKLFSYVLEKEGLSSERLVHFGDDTFSDVLVPEKMGIKIFKDGSGEESGRRFTKFKRYCFMFNYLKVVLMARYQLIKE